MKHFLLLLTLLLSFTFVFTQPRYTSGVQTHFGQFYRADMDSATMVSLLDSIKRAGIDFIRDECYWSDVETVRGVYDFPPAIDRYINAARERGIGVLLILNYNNPLYAAHAGAAVTTDSNRAAFAAYCHAAVSRYAPLGVHHYEIWNEPNIPIFWDPTPNAADYVKLLQAAYPAVKQADSTAVVMACATSPAEGNPAPFVPWLTYIGQVATAGGLQYMDAVSFHLYRVDRGPELWLQNDINSLQAIVGAEKPLWLTETGYPTSTVWPNVTLAAQGVYTARLLLLARGIPQLASVCWYDSKNDGQDPANNEHNFGLLNFDLTHKPAWLAYAAIMKEIGQKICIGTVQQPPIYNATFAGATDTTVAVWHSTSSGVTDVPLPRNTVRIRTLYGKTWYATTAHSRLQLTATTEPQFITGIDTLPPLQKLTFSPGVDTIVVGQKMHYRVTGLTADSAFVYLDSLAVTWSTDGGVASVDSTGTVRGESAGRATVTASIGSYSVQKSITVLPSYGLLELEPFTSITGFAVSDTNLLAHVTTALVDSQYTSPPSALALSYSLKFINIASHKVFLRWDRTVLGQPDSIMVDLFNNGNSHAFEFQLTDRFGATLKVGPVRVPSVYGWTVARASLLRSGVPPAYPVVLRQMVVYPIKDGAQRDSVYSGTIILDDLRVHGMTSTNVAIEPTELPRGFALEQNYPNPFNPVTQINYTIGQGEGVKGRGGEGEWSVLVQLTVYDLLGREVAVLVNERQAPGPHQVTFNAAGLPTGVYFYRLQTGGVTLAKRMMLVK